MSDGESWPIPQPHWRCLPASGAFKSGIHDAGGPWADIHHPMSSGAGFPTDAFRGLLGAGNFNVRWPLSFAAWRWFATGASVDRECAGFLSEAHMWVQAWAALEEYVGEYTGLPWLSVWRSGFERTGLMLQRQRGESFERYALDRGDTTLGVVTRGPWDGHQGSWRDWGWLEPDGESRPAIGFLEEEEHLLREVMRLEAERLDSAPVLARAERLQAEFMEPGVELLSLADGKRWGLIEFHLDLCRAYWS